MPPSIPALGKAGRVDVSHLHSCDVGMHALLEGQAVYGQQRELCQPGGKGRPRWGNGQTEV